MADLSVNSGNKMHLSKKTEIAYLKADEALTKVFSKYADFIDVFLSKLAIELFEQKKINNHAIELIDD